MLIKKKFYTKREINYIKETVDIRKLMEYFGEEPDRNGFYICPNPEHNDIHPSCQYANIKTETKKFCNCLTCFSCPDLDEKRVNVIDNIKLVQYKTGKRDFISIMNFLIDFLNGNPEVIVEESRRVEIEEEKKVEEKTKEEDAKEEYYKEQINKALEKSKTIHERHLEHKYFVDKYLESRGIRYQRIKDFLEKNNIEIRHYYYNDINSCLINIDNKQIIQREIEDYLQNNPEKPHGKYVKGHNTYSYINQNNTELMIFEGFYDFLSYLSIMEVDDFYKTDFVVLNSTSNVRKLLEEQKDELEEYKSIGVFTDNDKAGKRAAERIQKGLEKPDIEIYLPKNKDWNEDIVQILNLKRQEKEEKRKLKEDYRCKTLYSV